MICAPKPSVWRAIGVLAVCACALGALAFVHPATIPVARAQVQTDGTIDLEMRFDILAFILEEDPMTVLDDPMNKLLDGPDTVLDASLAEAKKRFLSGLEVVGGKMESLSFPTAADIHHEIANAPPPRLPVMMLVKGRFHLAPVVNRFSMRFPRILGTVILTTERPYCEPVTVPVEPTEDSEPIKIPTEAEVANLKAQMNPSARGFVASVQPPTLPEAKVSIQAQYDRWTKAYMAHDVPTLLAILSPDYTLKTANGTVLTAGEYKAMLEVQRKKHDDTTVYKTEIQRINLHENIAAVYSRETTTNRTPDPKTHRDKIVSYQHDYIDAWEYREGQWLLKSTVTLKEQVLPSKGSGSSSG